MNNIDIQIWESFCADRLGLRPAETSILSVLYFKEGLCTHDQLAQTTAKDRPKDYYGRGSVPMHLSRMRRKLAPHKIIISSKRGIGHRLTQEGKSRIDEMLSEYSSISQISRPAKVLSTVAVPQNFLKLTHVEAKYLGALLSTSEICTRQMFLEKVYGEDHPANERLVDGHINMVREKLAPYHIHIDSARGLGYVLPAVGQLQVRGLIKIWNETMREIFLPGKRSASRAAEVVLAHVKSQDASPRI